MASGRGGSEGQSAGVGESVAPQGSRLNVELLRKVRDAIADEANPLGFDMGAWAPAQSRCGTACCIAGHTLAAAGLDPDAEHPRGRAAELLGLDHDEYDMDGTYLFYGLWADGCDDLKTITRAEAVAYLGRCIAAGEIVR